MTSATTPKLLWVNSPSNPTGQVLGIEHLAKVVRWARQHGVIVASDECYAELDWRDGKAWTSSGLPTPGAVPSILDPRVCDGSHEGLLAVYSLSKQSNMAGYRAAFVAGDPALVGRLLEIRKHAGMMVPWPVQQAMLAALTDDTHVAQSRGCGTAYGVGICGPPWRTPAIASTTPTQACTFGPRGAALTGPGPGARGWSMVAEMADLGILVAPGSFYGAAGAGHVRIALTATDERISAAARRLAQRGQGT